MSEATATAFGLWLKHRRSDLGLTQQELADRVQCSKVTIEKIEAGKRRPSDQIALQIARCFNVPATEWRAFIEYARAEKDVEQLARLTAGMDHAPWRALYRATTNLPAPITSFVGREELVEAGVGAVRQPQTRLLTLVGPPGIGKTRLSLQIAEALLGDFEDGVFFVALGSVRDPELVVSEIAHVVGARESRDRPLMEALKSHLANKRLLLVLDNFEQVVEAGPHVIDLLQAGPWLKAIVTSRELLHLYGEHAFPVLPMSVPGGNSYPSPERLLQYEAVRLFVERALAARPDFALTSENSAQVVEICVRLDRLPLAIELAAARVKTLSLAEIGNRLESKLELLMDGARDLPLRQRALRSAIDWSFDLLSERERAIFRRLSVLLGEYTREAILEVVACKDTAQDVASPVEELSAAVIEEGLVSLVDKSLVTVSLARHRHQSGDPGSRFYSMLETIREYASAKLHESMEEPALRRQHALYYMGLAEQAQTFLQGSEQALWLERLEVAHDNLRAALDHLLANRRSEMALRLSSALWRFWYLRGHITEGKRWLAKALEQKEGVPPAILADALNAAGNLAWASGDFEYARPAYQECLAICEATGDKRGMSRPLNNLAVLAHAQGDYPRAIEYFEKSLALKRELGDIVGTASSLNGLGVVVQEQGDYERARALHNECLQIWKETGSKHGLASSLTNLGITVASQGDTAYARALYEESIAIRKELGDRQGIAALLINMGETEWSDGRYAVARDLYQQSLAVRRELNDKHGLTSSLHHLGYATLHDGQSERARELLRESLTLLQELADKTGMAESLAGFAAVAVAQRHPRKAARLYGCVEQALEQLQRRLPPMDLRERDRNLTILRDQISEADLKEAWQEGRAMSLADGVAYAMSEGWD